MVNTPIPVTPSVATYMGTKQGDVRTFTLTASEFVEQIANFPLKTARVWGYNGSTPGPTLVAYEDERVRIVVKNELPDPAGTTIHFHGLHEPNEDDGVAGISQPNPIPPGQTYTYGPFKPGHAGTFAYHSHTNGAVQELRGLDGFFLILPRTEPISERANEDFAMVLQSVAPPGEGQLLEPFPPGTGDFPFRLINGKTGEAEGSALTIHKGDLVRIRVYNASNESHAMHLHGHDFVVASKNGHPIPKQARFEETTQTVDPGDFYELEFRADNPGNWIFHCHFPHHTSNMKMPGWHGSPVGMIRIFHYAGYKPVPPEYFQYQG